MNRTPSRRTRALSGPDHLLLPPALRRPRRLVRAVVLPLLAAAISGRDASATTVLQLDFLTLHRRAGSIVHARCLSRKEVADGEPLPYTEYVFEVVEALKGCRDGAGKALERITFRHAGTRSGLVRPDGTKAAPLRLGLPEYAVGDEAVLFLTPESPWGLCAPVGLFQGHFRVTQRDGRAWVRNDMDNRGLFRGVGAGSFRGLRAGAVTALATERGGVELESFLDLCRKVSE